MTIRRRTAIGAALLLCLIGAQAPVPAQAIPVSEPVHPTAKFDWSMPDRTVDADGSGTIDEYIDGNRTANVPQDGRYRVVLNACSSWGDIERYSWDVGSQRTEDSSSCETSVSLPEGRRAAKLTVSGPAGTDSVEFVLNVVDHLIVSLGDSYASGEGNPDVRGNYMRTQTKTPAKWKHEPCHRSSKAGPALAALALEEADRRSSVTFIHLACSGAKIDKGLLGSQQKPGDLQPPQLSKARQLVQGQPIDAMTLTIGGNDIYFSKIILNCEIFPNCPNHKVDWDGRRGPESEIHPVVQRALGMLPAKYNMVDDCLRDRSCVLSGGLGSVHLPAGTPLLVTDYPDVSTATDGSYCQDGGISNGEFAWADQVVLKGQAGTTHRLDRTRLPDVDLAVSKDGLNRQIGNLPSLGWTTVSTYKKFTTHGYCAGDNAWIGSISRSLDWQGDTMGGFHPNERGHQEIRDILLPQLKAALIQVLPPTAPRAVTAVSNEYGEATVSWTAPLSDGGAPIWGYSVSSQPASEVTAAVGQTTATLTGLTPGATYTFTVDAVNEAGLSEPSSPSAPVLITSWTTPPTTTQPTVSFYLAPDICCPRDITPGPDGAMWFTNYATGPNEIGRVTTNGAVTSYNSPATDRPTGITVGPDGALWFTDDGGGYGVSSIGRITTSGAVSTFTDSRIVAPQGITTGPDGALWFTQRGMYGSSGIGRITTGGVVSTYTDPSITGGGGIVTGSDGALWFTNMDSNSIGRITTNGVVSNYTGSGINRPGDIASGPDGALWFTNAGSNSIGRITTAGSVATYTAPGVADPLSIATGPDGALWFTNPDYTSQNHTIGRVTTGGSVSIYSDPGIRYPVDIAAGPDGALWFTNGGSSGAIGRIEAG